MITLEVNGSQFSNFVSANVTSSMDTLCRSFSFVAIAPDAIDTPFPVKAGDACRVFVDDTLVLTGWVEQIELNYSRDNHNLTISGRDKTCDLVDSTIGTIEGFKAGGGTLSALIKKIVDHLGMDVEVIEEVTVRPFKSEEDATQPEVGDNCFKYIEKYSQKRQVLLTSDAKGNVVITRNYTSDVAGTLKHVIGAEDNNILTCSYSIDTSKRFRKYEHRGAGGPISLNNAGATSADGVVDQAETWFDESIRPSRQLVTMSKLSSSKEETGIRALWEGNIRSARSEKIRVSTPGFQVQYDSGGLWKSNRLYEVEDEFLGARDPMLCSSVQYKYDRTNGSTTELTLVGSQAYVKEVIGPFTLISLAGFSVDKYFKAFKKASNFIKGLL